MSNTTTKTTINRDSLSTLLYRLLAMQNDKMESLQKDPDVPTEDQIVTAFNQLRETRAHIHALYEYDENSTKIDVINPC